MVGAGMEALERRRRASGMLGVSMVVRGRMCERRLVMAGLGRSWAPEVASMTCGGFG